ncbi:MAG TPA: VWA domain-containing protein [Chloroflexota bacterium]|nr:VWA domain-containing protein [Chloroflexota bacterium]
MEQLLMWVKEQGVEFRLPTLLWGAALVPALLVFYVGARRSRRHVARAFRVVSYRPKQSWRGAVRAFAMALTWLGLTAASVGFARPVIEVPTPDDRATVVLLMDASLAMRATDVRPTRLDAAKGAARTVVNALPERVNAALVAYSAAGYIVQPPTHDHGAVPAALGRLRTADGAALGDALLVALAAIPNAERADGGAAPATAPGGAGGPGGPGAAPKVPSAIVLISTGDVTGGRELGEAAATLREASVPVHVVSVGPRAGTELKAPFDEAILRQVAQATGGRVVVSNTAREWQQIFRSLGSEVKVEVRPQEVGQFVGAGGLVAMGLGMVVMLAATRRLV